MTRHASAHAWCGDCDGRPTRGARGAAIRLLGGMLGAIIGWAVVATLLALGA